MAIPMIFYSQNLCMIAHYLHSFYIVDKIFMYKTR
jgi:hypothetical protein